MKKTSLSHPLQIATISAGSEFGRVGINFCPGKYDRHARSGEWNRDLALDLNTIRDWGAAAVVTLLEPKELALLRVEGLGEEVLRRNVLWFHLPIVDACGFARRRRRHPDAPRPGCKQLVGNIKAPTRL
jgi:ADP-ribosyl-[dinitrogen reductase] hydrolase